MLLTPAPIHIRVDTNHVIRLFNPRTVFGAGLDGHEKGENEFILSRRSIKAMNKAGFGPLTYRLRTELAGQVWHWNPEGKWSDQAHLQGYWTSSSKPGKPIQLSYGYRLPRRGNTIDQANNDDFSRIDDGDSKSFWKSNPYVDPRLGGDSYDTSPQWVVVDLGKRFTVDTIKIDWGKLYATKYSVDFWQGADGGEVPKGKWEEAEPVLGGANTFRGHPSADDIRLKKIAARYIRLRLRESSATAIRAKEIRDEVGFSICELRIGSVDSAGHFMDFVQHGKSNSKQSAVYVSSTDPWHRAVDIDTKIEQPGIDRVYRSGLTHGQGVMVPFGALYDTPDNVAAEASYLQRRHYKVSGYEIGEEPDGQSATPETYGTLYTAMAKRLHEVSPSTPIGGPSFQTAAFDFSLFPNPAGAWIPRFMLTLKTHGASALFNFCTTEWYPFENPLDSPIQQIQAAPAMLTAAINRLKGTGMAGMPWIITEYGLSMYGAQAEVELTGAIFNFDCSLTALGLGAQATYLYGYEPNELIQEVPKAWGNNMLFLHEQETNRIIPLATFYAADLLNHRLFDVPGMYSLLGIEGATREVGCYVVRGPDKKIRYALVNRSAEVESVSLEGNQILTGWSYGPSQYHWHSDADNGKPDKNKPPARVTVRAEQLTLPPTSLMILTATGK